VRTLVSRFPLDSTRVIAIGHSAGGHLALWLGGRSRLPSSSPLHGRAPFMLVGVVALGGPGDLADFTTYAQNICGAPVIEQLMGGAPATVPERYAQGSPRALLPLGTRQLLIVGADDGVMPERARNEYVAAARSAGDVADMIVVPDAGHFEVIAPTSAAWPMIRDRIQSLFPAP
ncbi:MAG: alpha/beta hydrolase family protein, partial [Tepidisphaeraceae bacterium]